MSFNSGMLTVQDMQVESDSVVSIGLARVDGQGLPSWTPGSHVDLELPNGMVRQYSLCGDPADRGLWRVAVLREPAGRGGSKYLHDQLRLRDQIAVAGPRNNFELVDAPSYTFVAGGIGITPLWPMIRAVEARGKPWSLHYGGRTRTAMAFAEVLTQWKRNVRVLPEDEHGLLPVERIVNDAPEGSAVYCCGPEPLLAAVEGAASVRADVTLHVERFSAKPSAGSSDGSFSLTLKRSGVTLEVPADRSIIEVLQDAGVGVPQSCLEGVCGSCETRVIEGVPDHRDSILSQQERQAGKSIFVCVSRAADDHLVLDL